MGRNAQIIMKNDLIGILVIFKMDGIFFKHFSLFLWYPKCRMKAKREWHIFFSCILDSIVDLDLVVFKTIRNLIGEIKRILFACLFIAFIDEGNMIVPLFSFQACIPDQSMVFHRILFSSDFIRFIIGGSDNREKRWIRTAPCFITLIDDLYSVFFIR